MYVTVGTINLWKLSFEEFKYTNTESNIAYIYSNKIEIQNNKTPKTGLDRYILAQAK